MTKPVFRFAPSPNGRLHLGHAYSALLNADFAGRFGGRFLLRIEDIDIARCRPEFEAAIYEDLAWLGLAWESPVRRQSEHFDDYRAAFLRLKERRAVYPCFCSRKDIAAAIAARRRRPIGPGRAIPDGTPLYPGTCRHLSGEEAERRIASGEPHAWRLDMARLRRMLPGALSLPALRSRGQRRDASPRIPARWGDAVIVRKDMPTSYHLSVVVDDALQGSPMWSAARISKRRPISTCCSRRLLGLPTPLYHHHGLVLDDRRQAGEEPQSISCRAARGRPAGVRRRSDFRHFSAK